MNSGFLSVLIAGVTPFIVLTLLFLGIGYHSIAWQPPALWTDNFGTLGDAVTVISADPTGVYAGGDTGGNLFLSRYNTMGHRVWTQSFASSYDIISGIAVGEVTLFISGQWRNGTNFVRGYNLTGTALWTINIKEVGVTYGPNVSAGAGSVFLSYYDRPSNSSLLRAYAPDGTSLWTDSLGNRTGVIALSTYSGDSRVYLLGSWNNLGSLRSYNSDGILNWAENLTCSCAPDDFAVDSSGIYVVGTSAQSLGLGGTLAKYDFAGNQLWVKNFDSPDGTTVGTPRISVDSSGIYLAGTTSFSGYLIRYDSNGNHVWIVEIPLTGNAVSAGQDGVYVGGGASNGVLSKYGQSSSLVLFGVNPPFSFGLVALLGGVVVLSLFWLRRQSKRGVRRPKSAVPYSPPKPSGDESKWMKRPP